MFYSLKSSIFRIFYAINEFKIIQNDGSKMAVVSMLKTS